jgi:hypothetical protein
VDQRGELTGTPLVHDGALPTEADLKTHQSSVGASLYVGPAARERVATDQPSRVPEFLEFLGQNKKWWVLPILLVMLFVGILILFSSTAVAPFIYRFF